jgi:G3E family GTPase
MPVAATFSFRDEHGRSLSDLARIDTMVTVVDAKNFLDDYQSSERLGDRGQSLGEDDERSVVDLLVDQVEFANVIVLNKCDLVSEDELARLEAILHHLNPDAEIVRATRGQVPLDSILDTKRFDEDKAAQSAGWAKELAGEHVPETEAYGISSFVYRARRPFHPKRLMQWFDSEWKGVIRSKGFFWLATRMDEVGSWSQAGCVASVTGAGFWWAAAPKEAWPDDAESKAEIEAMWQEPYGDRRQEIVLIGIDMDEAALREGFDRCLLTDEEFAAGPSAWALFEDPFEPWHDRSQTHHDETLGASLDHRSEATP